VLKNNVMPLPHTAVASSNDVIVNLMHSQAVLPGTLELPFHDGTPNHFLEKQTCGVLQLFQIIEHADILLVVIQNRQFCYISPASEKITGYGINELLMSSNFGQLLDLGEDESFSEAGKNNSHPYHEFRFITKHQEEHWFDCSVKKIVVSGQSTKIVTAVDVTSRRKSEIEYSLAVALQSHGIQDAKQSSVHSIFPTCPQLAEIFNYIEKNYHQSISLDDVAREVGYSAAYLTDWVRRLTGRTLNKWIIERRMVAACTLLRETNQSIELIAEAIGYQNTGHFFRQFRQHFGTTPLAWRKANRNRPRVAR
jgi:PAS domain S-box-containing protein